LIPQPPPPPPALFQGDGSLPAPGRDVVTVESKPTVKAKPDYLKNPAPSYPWEARQNGWQGTVLIKVFVDEAGRAVRTEMSRGSGHDILDRSALKAVKSWRFRPARLGALTVESSVLVPVRFELEKTKK
jgi:protein TonB